MWRSCSFRHSSRRLLKFSTVMQISYQKISETTYFCLHVYKFQRQNNLHEAVFVDVSLTASKAPYCVRSIYWSSPSSLSCLSSHSLLCSHVVAGKQHFSISSYSTKIMVSHSKFQDLKIRQIMLLCLIFFNLFSCNFQVTIRVHLFNFYEQTLIAISTFVLLDV